MGKTKTRVTFSALDHMDPRVIEPVSDAKALFNEDRQSSAPLRAELGTNSDASFMAEIVSALQTEGLTPEEAESVAALVALQPSLALLSDGRVRQSVVVAAQEASAALADAMRVTVSGRIVKSAWGGGLADLRVEIEPFDLEDERELGTAAARVASDLALYPVPRSPSKPRFTLVVLGNPVQAGAVADSEVSWNDHLGSLAAVLGFELRIVTTRNEVKSPYPKNTKLTVAFEPGLVGQAVEVGLAPLPTHVDFVGQNVSAVVAAIATLALSTLSEMEEAEAPFGTELATLHAGDQHFYRKLDSSAAFDKFNPTSECSHDAGWVRYTKAPKATKGMRRIYINFDDDMLYHCAKGYRCGVYAVFAPESL